MRLATKIFLTSALVIVALAVVGILSLGAIGRLVSVNREITTQTVPALRLATAARDAMSVLARMEARLVVMRDVRYARGWTDARATAFGVWRSGAILWRAGGVSLPVRWRHRGLRSQLARTKATMVSPRAQTADRVGAG